MKIYYLRYLFHNLTSLKFIIWLPHENSSLKPCCPLKKPLEMSAFFVTRSVHNWNAKSYWVKRNCPLWTKNIELGSCWLILINFTVAFATNESIRRLTSRKCDKEEVLNTCKCICLNSISHYPANDIVFNPSFHP